MMMNKCCSSHRSCDKQRKEKDHVHAKKQSLANDDQKNNIGSSISRMFRCDLCHRMFTSGTALGGHKSHHHRSDNLLQQPVTKKRKNDVDNHRKQKHACLDYDKLFSSKVTSQHENGSFKGIQSQTTPFPDDNSVFSFEKQSNMCDHDQFQVGGVPPPIDLSKHLPPWSCMIDHELLNAASILFDMSRAGAGANHDHTHKRLKLSSNIDNVKGIKNNSENSLKLRFKIKPSSSKECKDNNIWDCNQRSSNDIDETPATKVKDSNNSKMSLELRLKIPHSSSKDNKILQTSEGCSQHASMDIEETKKKNEAETGKEQSHNERVVRNFDLNELPTEHVTDE